MSLITDQLERPKLTASGAQMHELGVLPAEHPLLNRAAAPFRLPAEADDATRIVEELLERADRIRAVHTFSKGMGLAAPQLGIDRRTAIVCPPNRKPIVLINAEIVAASAEEDQPRFEGCLSFFDVRGRVIRPLRIDVTYQKADGTPRRTTFAGSEARLVAHEIDHLDGHLYLNRMVPGEAPIPVREYHETGLSWKY
jgi:peptide deformylase